MLMEAHWRGVKTIKYLNISQLSDIVSYPMAHCGNVSMITDTEDFDRSDNSRSSQLP